MSVSTEHHSVKFVEDPKQSDSLASHDQHKIHISQLGPTELQADLGLLQEGCEYSVEVDLNKAPAALDMARAFKTGMQQDMESSSHTVRLLTYDPNACIMTIHITADVPKKWSRHLAITTSDGATRVSFTLLANVLRKLSLSLTF